MKFDSKVTGTLLCVLLFSCTIQKKGIQVKSGDLLFQGADSTSLSDAIDKVTQTCDDTHFSHVGLVEVADDGRIFVLHANTYSGTCRVSLQQFLDAEDASVQTVVYRLKEPWQKTIPAAIAAAKKMLDRPYNFSYILSDSSHYCSEFVFKAFESDSVFELNPMTFKDPETSDFYPTWTNYYAKMGIDVPEGEPGCNPNGMAVSPKLERIGVLAY
ncbi:YiiX/YebB-like N1pC/P60 family cysteine hydrolase [Mangrovibacterium sp.]|uniref:YiiX/YebB-like N1pC/P60 family cysteine hydrolase n=1 Tax=Mangrovibacterium sp. TaxID=1961364 RepID=UPI00356A0C6E